MTNRWGFEVQYSTNCAIEALRKSQLQVQYGYFRVCVRFWHGPMRSHHFNHPVLYAVGDIGFNCSIGTDCWTQVYLKFSIIFRGVSFRFFRDRLQSSSSSSRSSGSLLMRTMSLALKNSKGLLVASLLWDDISLLGLMEVYRHAKRLTSSGWASFLVETSWQMSFTRLIRALGLFEPWVLARWVVYVGILSKDFSNSSFLSFLMNHLEFLVKVSSIYIVQFLR